MKNDPIQGILFDANPELRFIVGRSASMLRLKRYLWQRKEREASHDHLVSTVPVVRVALPASSDRISQDSVVALSQCLRTITIDDER